MTARAARPTGVARTFSPDEIIVSKTDPRGLITYANRVFVRVSGYEERELHGAPHSILRHPDMPRCVFKYLWDTIAQRREVFAYVLNLAKNGDHYWVLAHVTATCDDQGVITGYHSNRRLPDPAAVAAIEPLYASLLEIERSHPRKADGLAASTEALRETLQAKRVSYDEFVWSLTPAVAA
ncbi:MAG: PAS domain-containing protein [Polyangiales bacterium]